MDVPAQQKLRRLLADSFSTFRRNKDDSSRYLSIDKQDFVRKAVKTAPMNAAAELIKNVQGSPTKQIDLTLFAAKGQTSQSEV